MKKTALSVENLTKIYSAEGKKTSNIKALNNITLSKTGRNIWFVGT